MSNYKHKKQPRLVQSHWDLEDEFINLSMPSEISTNYELIQALGQSSSKHHHLLLLVLFAHIFLAIALTIKRVMATTNPTKVDKKRPVVTTRAKRRESPCAATVSSPPKRARRVGTTKRRYKFRASNLMKEKFSDGDMSSAFPDEPILVDETKQVCSDKKTKQVCGDDDKVDVKKTSVPTKKTSAVRDGGALIRTSTSQGPHRTLESQVSSISIHEESETVELAQKIMRSADVLKEQGLDEEDAKKLATQLELGKKQLADEQKHQNQRMMTEMKVRSFELQRTEARHQETVKAQQVDRDWVRKCIEARDKLLAYSTRAFLYLLFAMVLDQLFKTGLDTLRSALQCECQSHFEMGTLATWSNIKYAFSPYLAYHSTPISCWMTCYRNRFGLLVGTAVVKYMGMTIQDSVILASALYIFWNGSEELPAALSSSYFVVCGSVVCSAFMYAWTCFRHQSMQRRMKHQPDNMGALDEYFMECDHAKLWVNLVVLVLFGAFQVENHGFVLGLISEWTTAPELFL